MNIHSLRALFTFALLVTSLQLLVNNQNVNCEQIIEYEPNPLNYSNSQYINYYNNTTNTTNTTTNYTDSNNNNNNGDNDNNYDPNYYYYYNSNNNYSAQTTNISTARNDYYYPYSTNENDDQLICTLNGKTLTCNNGLEYVQKEETESGWELWVNIFMCVFIVLFAGLMSGLTMGLMSMDMMNLKIVQKSGSDSARKYATKIMPLVEKHHLLLVTLLIGNSLAMEALPIFLDRIIGSIGAILISVTMVLLFGEIIPQAICTRYGLAIGAYLAWLVWILIFVFFIIAYPVSKLLDWMLGKETGTTYRRAELKELVDIHEADVCQDPHHHHVEDLLSKEEAAMLKQILDFKLRTGEEVMTPIKEVMMVSYYDIIDYEYVKKLVTSGFSKWPVFMKKRDNIIGFITLQDILQSNYKEKTFVSNIPITRPPIIHQKLSLNEILKLFQKGNYKMALIVDHFDCVTLLGIVTFTDILKQLFGSLKFPLKTPLNILQNSNQIIISSKTDLQL